jgi:hypothetical protein
MKRYRESFLAAFLQLNSQPRRGVRRFDCVRRARPRINPPKLARFSPKGSGQGYPLLRASNEHRPSNLIDPSKLACVSLGMAPVLVPLRPSSEHILIMRAPGARNQHGCHSIPFIVRVLRARRAPGHSLPIIFFRAVPLVNISLFVLLDPFHLPCALKHPDRDGQ